jgi:16S rRNA (guanine527-N7)-methyltransferase
VRFLDLGAGGGLPSLPILVARPSFEAVLLDAIQTRCSFLVWAAGRLGLTDRVEVWSGRAEAIGHEDRARFGFDAVVARGFGPPAQTVECAAPLLRPGGRLVISEPPEERTWPDESLAAVGLHHEVDVAAEGVVVLRRIPDIAVDDRYPRRIKVQQRTPLF